ncbi:MAG: hypothetical protein FJ225_09135 [Lentisphaerae bacterium]|nr:hypothetical protein [Lentisphaerota bacterium]
MEKIGNGSAAQRRVILSVGRRGLAAALALLAAEPCAGTAFGLQARAAGGAKTEVYVDGVRYRVHTFTESGVLTVTFGGEIEYLIVGGGGGGGNGGGGAGGFREGTTTVKEGPLNVLVGAGGKGGTKEAPATDGGPSALGGMAVIGGGRGASTERNAGAAAGGSGGGGTHNARAGAHGTPGQGNRGGDGLGGVQAGGGGGGAGGPGASVSRGDTETLFPGGPGRSSSITGAAVTYAAGGSGRRRGAAGGRDGAANTGNGGDGGRDKRDGEGGDGGSGIVVVRYREDIQNLPAAHVTTNRATFRALLTGAESPSAVCLLWGRANGAASGAWARTNWFKASDWANTNRLSLRFSLFPDTGYRYTFGARYAAAELVAEPPEFLVTGEVAVRATRRDTTEDDPAAFVISRPATAANGPLVVAFTLSESVNAVDFDQIDSPAVIPDGATEVRLPVIPIFRFGDDRPRFVTLTVDPEGPYCVGRNGSARILLRAR